MPKDTKTTAPTFTAGAPLAELPKRETPKRSFNKEAAAALLAVVSVEGATATDGETHKTRAEAQKRAASAKRLLGHVLPDGKRSRTRVYSTGESEESGPFAWAIWLADAKASKAEAKS